jgi:hypothetical protein
MAVHRQQRGKLFGGIDVVYSWATGDPSVTMDAAADSSRPPNFIHKDFARIV